MEDESLLGAIILVLGLIWGLRVFFTPLPEGHPKSLKELEELIEEAKNARARNRTRKLR